MSAIAGFFLLDGRPVEPGLLAGMTQRLSHRGPDGVHHWSAGSVGLGHCMRHTTPESLLEKLPLRSRDGTICLTSDARIDNREELLGSLDVRAVTAVTSRHDVPDSAFILAAYRKWGEECAGKLCGDFAFAIWDEAQQHLFCARDHMGVKPFYYFHDAHIFAFATEIKAILALEGVPRRLNEARIADYLLANFQDTTSTLYKGIRRLPAAHTLCVHRKTLRTQRYWSLDPNYQLSSRNDAEYAEAFRDCFRQAVASRLRSVFATGSTLSGGLDSSANVVMACDILRDKPKGNFKELHTFSAIYDQATSSDERAFIHAVLEHVGGDAPRLLSHYVHPDRLSPLTEWNSGAEIDDEPLWNPQMALHWSLYEAARQNGVRALLDGYGGDDVVSNGVPYLNELASCRAMDRVFAHRTCSGRKLRFIVAAHHLARRCQGVCAKLGNVSMAQGALREGSFSAASLRLPSSNSGGIRATHQPQSTAGAKPQQYGCGAGFNTKQARSEMFQCTFAALSGNAKWKVPLFDGSK
jgi:asparagine synthase (glutamine-hydrolysing)